MLKFSLKDGNISRAHSVTYSHTAQFNVAIKSFGAFFFGIPFFCAGLAIILLSMGVIEYDPEDMNAPPWVLGVGGGMFFLPGIIFILIGFQRRKEEKKIKRGKRDASSTPWEWDYPQGPEGYREKKEIHMIKHTILTLIVLIFMIPFNYWAFFSGEGDGIEGIVLFFDLIPTLGVVRLIYLLVQFKKFGNSSLQFETYPFFLGEKISLVLWGLPVDKPIQKLDLKLKCIEEEFEWVGGKNAETKQMVPYLVYCDSRTVDDVTLGDGGELAIEWELPPDEDFDSQIAERPSIIWELEVTANLKGLNYNAYFLLPVYLKR